MPGNRCFHSKGCCHCWQDAPSPHTCTRTRDASPLAYLRHCALRLCPDVVNRSNLAPEQHALKRLCHVLDVQVRAHRLAIAVQRQLLTTRCKDGELGDHLLWELVRPVHIVATRDDNGHLVRGDVGLAQHLGTGLGCRVRVSGVQVAALKQALLLAKTGLAVHLICGHIDEAHDGTSLAASLQQHMRSVRVVHSEGHAVPE
eukprot:363664-Chlamydomonas_euryale.AAC.27